MNEIPDGRVAQKKGLIDTLVGELENFFAEEIKKFRTSLEDCLEEFSLD